MSVLQVNQLQAPADNGNVITMVNGSVFDYPGRVVQVQHIRSDTMSMYTSLTTGNGTTIFGLNIPFKPKFSNSLLIIEWMVNCELHQDNVFLIHKNGSLITTSGYEGYNNQAGNQRWSGYVSAMYDADESTTPGNFYILYSEIAGSTDFRTYAPAVRGSGGSQYTFYLNRTISAPGDNNEFGVSTGTIMEIAQ